MTKIISITDEAYERLKKLKGDDSFTKVILRLTDGKRSLREFAGMWKDDPEVDRVYASIIAERHAALERKW